ncbi:hypothetical protein SEVIR_2G209300v4 [Setaria viridis]|uniref:SprT-like domain-containing protein n=1 Tax=Setaria viridis TaxID=4556 RepID=A0A4U6VYD3_SETVI|nr:muscle M-line assembly protein unc-89-like isoform X1 [Setaria viridis]TKW33069.1 hypothetical protein SEVIR_2G209300v2 [Setaria viridis]
MGDVVEEADLADPNPDVQDLFQHYDRLYFRGALAGAGFIVKWASSPAFSSFGSCTFSKPRNTITLSEPVLKYLSCTDRKNALLHEMIHAIIYVKHHRKDRSHGPLFRAWMDAINSCSIKDHQKPDGGYNITTRHDFSPEEPHSLLKGTLWKCGSCGDTHFRAKNQGPPSDACCIENVKRGTPCGNMLCHWHNHKNDCRGTYEKTKLESDALSQKKVPGGAQLLLTSPSEMSKSKGAIQESSSSALQGNTKATKPSDEDKHIPLVSGSNGKPQGSSSVKKAGKRRWPEVVPETSVLLAEFPRKSKGKQDLVAAEDDLFSLVSCGAPKSSRSSKKVVKADMQRKPEDVQKPSGLPASPQGKPNQKKVGKQHKPDDQKPSVLPSTLLGTPKLKHALVTTEKDKPFSAEGCNDTKSLGSTSKKAEEQHEPQIAQKACSQTAYPQKILKQDLVALEKKEPSPTMGCSNEKLLDRSSSKKAHRQHEPEDIRKTILPAALKKAGERHEPQIAQKACSQPAYPQKRLKQELAVLEKKEPSPTMGCSNEKLLDRSSSKKAHRQHEPEDIRKTTVLPAAPGSKPKASGFVASGNQRKGKCKRKPVREKEYAVMSAYLDYYESDRSSGSTESLVNKRTERRKRERERARILTYSRSKKLNPAAPLVYSRTNASVSSHRIEMLPHRDGLIQQSLPPPPCSDNAILTTANQVVVTEATGDHSEPSAPCLDIVPLQPAEPPGLTPPDQSTAPDIIDISDDDLP